jgi:hypothetical protein
MELNCRVCGLAQTEPPWGADGKSPNFLICGCCGTEFGYEDCTPAAVEAARERWKARGFDWFCPEERPRGWTPPK